MCGTPDVPEPTQYQASKAPVFNTASRPRSKSGRQGTILTEAAGQTYAPDGKKTLLGA
ncbi:hypothetical protein [Paracoccus denitrificans]|jgi:hypothetical protein|uniref:hypothetical protein n=1 Tax=Paracoccus denitrificans TaxID=266 RepID=UPI0000554C50|nr:hypothetical protein [Paracoccus denitrificans]MBB4628071.1 hypothetical protein [Paracoccus denitrificans]MCU7429138.1 hypothetical protein [Paracoccus denitrificans]UPV96550.1 hypothetical protein M0K93_19195 [Paracoccus denitrificans]WQO36075.1 hypothetical protein U0005_16485 [Paracoccus denitrificans]SDJ13229.1 hypothetical protein SAMN04244581_03243 [Paracoccus denitrificans]